MKAAPDIYSLLDSHLGSSARTLYIGLKKTSNTNGTLTGYPAIEAVFDAFGGFLDCIEQFEVSQRPTIQIALPLIFQIMRKLQNITYGLQVWGGEGQAIVYPSVYSRALARVMHEHMLNYVWGDPLLLVGCLLNPLFR